MGHLLQLTCREWADRTSHRVPQKGGTYKDIKYRELWEIVRGYAGALRELGLERGDRMAIFSENSFDWMMTDWAAQTLGVVPVPIYPTLPSDQALFVFQDCGAKIALCGSTELMARLAGERTMLLGELADKAKSSTISDEDWQPLIDAVQFEDIATFIYTSGTTADPKGAMLSHRALTRMMMHIRDSFDLTENDTWLGFLPLSHVMERVNGHFLPTAIGATQCSAGSLASVGADMLKVQPTMVPVVPRFLDAMRSRIIDAMKKESGLKQKLFQMAMDQGKRKFLGQPAPLYGLTDALVGKKIRARTGGRLRFMVSGGAALPAHVAEFFGGFGILVLQGYGLTETCSGICVNQPDDSDYRTIGTPLSGVEMKIADDGEILIRGDCLMTGYYNRPEDTANAIDPEGWFHSGDIGERRADGKFLITDRKKDILVLGNGKNVAPQPIENLLKESVYIQEAVLFGDGMEYCCALIVPDWAHVRTYAQQQGVQGGNEADLMAAEPVRQLIKAEVAAANKKLADFQKVKRFELVQGPFSVEGGELTPSLKVRRRVVKERYLDLIQGMGRS